MQALGAKHQVIEGQIEQRFDLISRPVVAYVAVGHDIHQVVQK
jgi:hypothetical protein